MFAKHRPVDYLPGHLRCSWCGSHDTTLHGSSGLHYCVRCSRFFRDAPEMPFDVVADQWTQALGALQAAGEIIAVRLPAGFYGVCLLPATVEYAQGKPNGPKPLDAPASSPGEPGRGATKRPRRGTFWLTP